MIKKYVIKRDATLCEGIVNSAYYGKDRMTPNIKEAKRFISKLGAAIWLHRHYFAVDNFFGFQYSFELINLNRRKNEITRNKSHIDY